MGLWTRAMVHLRPPEKLSPSEWAERHIRIPAGNALPGPIRFANVPYQRQPLDMVADPECRQVTLMWGAQLGKTQVLNCSIAYYIAQRPASQMVMQPSQGDLQTWLETKLQPLIDSTPEVRRRMAKPRGRAGVNNQRLKSYPGGFLMFSWAGSAKTMRGRSAPIIYPDEVDGYEVTSEGHPVSLLWERAKTFGSQRKLVCTSTPTLRGTSYIEAAYLAGDRRRYWIPCPHCQAWQTLEWEFVVWGKDPDTGEDLADTASYHCRHCGAEITDGHKVQAVRRGEWRAERPFRGHASFHLSELYSPFRRWRDIVESYLQKRDTDDLQTFVNVSLAQTWEETGEQAAPEQLMARAEEYRAQVPAGAVFLTAGVDMQMDRLEVEVVGWGKGEESWSIAYRVLWGDPMSADVWEELDELLSETWQHETGAVLGIAGACLDTGGTEGATQAAYEYVRSRAGRKIFAIKGFAGWGRPVVGTPSKKKTARNARRVQLFPVGVDEAKVLVMRRLRRTEPGPGFCHFPTDRAAEWYAQLTAEKLITKVVKGFAKREWHLTRDRNEALDCRVYALAALKLLNPNLARLAKSMGVDDESAWAAEVAQRSTRLAEVLAGPTPANPTTIRPTEIPPEDDGAGNGKPARKWKKKSPRSSFTW